MEQQTTTSTETVTPETGETATAPAFYDQYDDDLKSFVTEKGFKDHKDMATALKNAKGLNIPNDDDEAGWNDFYTKLGRPEKQDDYEFSDLPEGVPFEDATHDFKKQTAFELGLNKKQAKVFGEKLDQMFLTTMDEVNTMLAEKHAAANAALQKEWGDSYNANMDIAQRAVKYMGADESDLTAIEQAIGADRMAKLLYPLGQLLTEGNTPEGLSNGGGLSKSDAKAKYEALSRDMDFLKKYRDNDPDAVKTMNDVVKRMNS